MFKISDLTSQTRQNCFYLPRLLAVSCRTFRSDEILMHPTFLGIKIEVFQRQLVWMKRYESLFALDTTGVQLRTGEAKLLILHQMDIDFGKVGRCQANQKAETPN